MAIGKEKLDALYERMQQLGIRDEDLVEKFILGSGRGGQKIQKTASCVYLHHLPTGIEIKCQQERSRAMNRFFARRLLCEKIEDMLFEEKSEKQRLASKIRKQKQRRSRRTKQKMVEEKKRRGTTKALRQSPGSEE